MNEILEEINAAFQTIKPIRRAFAIHKNGVNYACVVVALAIHRGVAKSHDPDLAKDDAANNCLDWASQVFGEDFIWGVISAWDGEGEVKNDADYLRGYALGSEAVKRLCPRDPPP